MMTANPFHDPVPLHGDSEHSENREVALTLAAKGRVSLTIREDSLIVSGNPESLSCIASSNISRSTIR